MFFRLRREPTMNTVAVPDSATDVPDVPAIRAGLLDLAERFAGLADEAMALAAAATAALPPGGVDDVAHGLRLDPVYGMQLSRLWHGSLRSRRDAGRELRELFDAIERTPR